MSRDLRAIKTEWGAGISLFIDPEDFPILTAAIVGRTLTEGEDAFVNNCAYEWSGADDGFVFRTQRGAIFLDYVRDCNVEQVLERLQGRTEGIKTLIEDFKRCLQNLKAVQADWRRLIDDDGQLEILVDGY